LWSLTGNFKFWGLPDAGFGGSNNILEKKLALWEKFFPSSKLIEA
jgi:hypothetical protein